MKTLYMVRHGQTLFNKQHKIQGWCDSPLTELGIKQAKTIGKHFKDNGIEFNYAYCSTSERTSDTLELITDKPYTRLKGLKEWSFGEFEGKDESLMPYPFGDFFVQFNGESEYALKERIRNTVTDIMNKEDHDCVLIVSHGAAIMNFFDLNKENGCIERIPGRFYPCSFIKFIYENNIFIPVDIYYNEMIE